jgi:glycosyltransferase involved in cell wall biosynthesis
MVGSFGLRKKGTMSVRALPMAQALAARGHSVTMLVPPWDTPSDSGFEVELGGVKVVNLALPPAIPLLYHLLIVFQLTWESLRCRPDVLHVFKPKAYAGGVAFFVWLLKTLRLCRVRLVIDADDWEGAGGWNDIDPISPLAKHVVSWQEFWGYRHADSLTVASRTLEGIAWSIGVPKRRVHYVPNGVQHWVASASSGARERVRAAHELGERPVVLLYTRFFEFSPQRVVEALARLRDRVPDFALLIVGSGLHSEDEQEFRRLLGIHELLSRTVSSGWVEMERLPEYFAAADVAIYPFDDTLVNRAKCAVKLIDLLAAGVPIVADRVGQATEYLEHGESGVLVEPGDMEGFASAVADLLASPQRRAFFAARSLALVNQRYAWGELAARVEEAYGLAVRERARELAPARA